MQATTEQLERFRAVLEDAQKWGLLAQGYNPANHNTTTVVHVGRKYARVDTGGSGKYMVLLATGEIFGIKAYGVPHPRYRYGTLETVGNWDWRGYTGHPRSTSATPATAGEGGK